MVRGPNTPSPNYDLASAWTSQKVSKLVFDTTVTPRWLETSDRFWYAYQTRDGRRFYLVDPLKKAKAPLFDHAKMAASLTSITGVPYDAQHLPFTSVRFIKNDAAFEFDIQVPRDTVVNTPPKKITTTDQAAGKGGDLDVLDDERDMIGDDDGDPQQQGQRGRGAAGGAPTPPRTRPLHFEYDMATAKLTLVEDYKAPARDARWASFSPDGKTVIFARNHNLFMMDADNYAKAQKKADDPAIVETQLTKDGEEYYSWARSMRVSALEQQQQQQQQQQDETEQQQTDTREGETQDKNARVPAIQISWAQDSSKFSALRRDQRKVKDLWVINALSNPRPTLETYRYEMPGEENITQSEIYIFDLATKASLRLKADRFKDQSLQVATKPVAGGAGGRGGGGGGATRPGQRPTPSQWLSPATDKIYITRLSRDMHKLDVCVADTKTGDVKPLIEERLNTYIESKPLRLADNGQSLLFWSERDGWGHFYLYDANTGTLKNRITEGEFVTTALEAVDDKARVAYISAAGREKGEDPYYTHVYRVGLDGTGFKLLDPGEATHAVSVSQSNKYFVDNSSRVNGSPESVLYDTMGTMITKLETPDLSALLEAGFKYPEPFAVKADDGVTDLYGVMYKPFDFDPEKKYPDHRLRLSRAADRERHEELQPAQHEHRARAVRLHRDRSGQPRRQPARDRSGTTTTATATCATTAWPTRRPRSSSSRAATRSSTSTRWGSGGTRAAGSCPRPPCWCTRTSSRWRGPSRATTRTTSTTTRGARRTTASRKSRRTARPPSSSTSTRTRSWQRTSRDT